MRGFRKTAKQFQATVAGERTLRRMVALGHDYHWMRHQRGGFWGYNPGTAGRKTDNSNIVITDPKTCDRGPYTDFCGYFRAGKSVVINQ